MNTRNGVVPTTATELQDRLERALAERYRVERELGRGGAAIVYLAADRKHGRRVAIKVLKPELAQAIGAERFLREIEIAARLSHPNILPLYDSGTADGLLYYVMPVVERESLRERLDRERQLALDDAVQVARQVASALAYAHAQGVVHRDIKPANILLHAGQAMVSDFGIARAIGEAGGDRLTETGLVVGTPAYMSPEQASGELTIDARSDVYSLGCVLYEMLAGDPPFSGSTPQAILARKSVEPPPRLRVVRDTVPPAIEEAVTKALAKVPADRFATAAHFSNALERALTTWEIPVDVHPRRRRVAVLGAAATVGLVLTGAIWWAASTRPGPLGTAPLRSVAVLPFENLSGDSTQEYFAAGMHDALIGELSQIGALRVISRRSVMRYQRSDKSVPEIARELDVDGVVEGTVLRSGDSVRIQVKLIEARPEERNLWGHGFERDLSDVTSMHGAVAQAIARELGVRLTPDQRARLASTRRVDPATYEAYLRGMFYVNKPGRENKQRGVALLHDAVDKNPGDAAAYAGLALGYAALGHGPAAQADAWPRARAAALRAVTLDSTLAEAHAALAEVRMYYEWDWAGAERAFQRALELNPNLAMAHYHYAWYHALFGRVDEAIAEHKRAEELDPLTPGHTAWLGTLYAMKGRHEDAAAEAQRALELSPDFPPGLLVLGRAYRDRGMHQQAIQTHERLAAVEPAWRWELGVTYAKAGRQGDARKILADLEAEKPTPWRAYALTNLYTALGDKDNAFRALAYEPHHAFVPWVRGASWAAPLRRDPRFEQFLRRLNFPKQ
jgi:TolB-like protein/tRNA A-37 threonylcarbamoyl transferase component Bud32